MNSRHRAQVVKIATAGSALLFLSACGGSGEPETPDVSSVTKQQPEGAGEEVAVDERLQISQEAGEALC